MWFNFLLVLDYSIIFYSLLIITLTGIIVSYYFIRSAWMRYHKHMKRKKALLAKKQEDARMWHQQRVQRVHLNLWIVSFHFVNKDIIR